MINSTSVIMPVVCNSEIAVKYMAQSIYGGYQVVANTEWRNQIFNSAYFSEFNRYATTVPAMTSNTTPSGEVIISRLDESNSPPYYCFDGNDATASSIPRPDTLNGYIGYMFEEKVMPYYVAILNYPSYENYLSNIKIQGSNDGTTYTDLTNVTRIGTSGWQYIKLLDETSYEEYKYIRVLQTTDKGWQYYAGAYTIQFYGRKM